jgi:hypothetical protein
MDMSTKSFDEQITGDPMAGRFTGLGFDATGILTAEASYRVRQREVGRFDLDPIVPDDVREHFNGIRNLHVHGCFSYQFFTTAQCHTDLAVEFVLKARLRQLHPTEAHRINRETLTPLWHRARRDSLLVHRSTGEFLRALDNYLDPIAGLGRPKGTFPVDRYDFEAVYYFRNHAAHPTENWVVTPACSARAIAWLAGFINSLWGPPPSLPFVECQRLADTLTRVVAKADAGQPSSDIRCLRAGLVTSWRGRDAGLAWGNEMVHRWEQTCDGYTHRYGVSVDWRKRCLPRVPHE